MKRSFANAILCLAVVAMLVGTAQAVTNLTNGAATIGAWTFDEKTPGNTTDGWPNTLGAIVNQGSGLNATAVGRLLNDDATDPTDPTQYHPIWPVYDVPSTPYGSNPSSLRFDFWANNEGASYAPALAIQSRIECPASENANWDMMLGDGGTSYTLECVIKPEVRGTDEGGYEGQSGNPEFYEGLICDTKVTRPNDENPTWAGGGFYMRTVGASNAANGFQLTLVSSPNGGTNPTVTASDLNLFDGNWHHLAAVIDSTGPGTGTITLWKDNAIVASGAFSGVANITPADDYPPPYEYGPGMDTDAMWLGDMGGRWNDQYIGLMDGAAFTRAALVGGLAPVPGNFVLNRAPEPSSIVLLVMGALALLAIRRVR